MKVKMKMKKPERKKKSSLSMKKKFCRFCADKTKVIDYKDAKMLESFIKDRGKIVSSRISGNCASHQRKIAAEIKQGRFISLLPYTRA